MRLFLLTLSTTVLAIPGSLPCSAQPRATQSRNAQSRNAQSRNAQSPNAQSPNTRSPNTRSPNVLVILIDALRADHTGFGGYALDTSPRLDALAAESLVFRNAFANSPWTKPSIPTLFTSLYPIQHGVYEGEAHARSGALESDILGEEFDTLAEHFRAAGYRTAGFVNNAHLPASQGFGQGFDVYVQADLDATEINRSLLDFLAESEAGAPFFAYLHYLDVHWPFQPGEPFRSRFAGVDRGGVFARASWRGLRDRINDGRIELTERDRRQLVALHDGGIAELDHQIGRLLDTLRSRGVLDQTAILVTSDHGEELLDHGKVGHGGTLYREVIEIPLLIRLPGHARTGEVSQPARIVDVLPTLLAAAGLPAAPRSEGRNLLDRAPASVEIIAETRHKRTYRVSLRQGSWKYIRTYRAPKLPPSRPSDAGTFGLGAGMRVKVKLADDGEQADTLYAHKLSIKVSADDDLELSGPVTSVDRAAARFVVCGYTVDAAALVDRDGVRAVDALSEGDWIKVEGEAFGSRQLDADKWQRLSDAAREIELEGIIERIDAGSHAEVFAVVAGSRIRVTEETRIKGLPGAAAQGRAPAAPQPSLFTPARLRSGEGLRVEEQLYDLATDPAEQLDRARDQQARVEAMRIALESWFARMAESSAGPVRRERLDDATIDQLRSLGYLE